MHCELSSNNQHIKSTEYITMNKYVGYDVMARERRHMWNYSLLLWSYTSTVTLHNKKFLVHVIDHLFQSILHPWSDLSFLVDSMTSHSSHHNTTHQPHHFFWSITVYACPSLSANTDINHTISPDISSCSLKSFHITKDTINGTILISPNTTLVQSSCTLLTQLSDSQDRAVVGREGTRGNLTSCRV